MGFHGKKVFARNSRANTFLPLNDEVAVKLRGNFKYRTGLIRHSERNPGNLAKRKKLY